MLQRLVESSLRHRVMVLLVAMLFAAYGAFVASQSRLDVFPDFVPPQVDVQTEAPGMAPEQVEQLITRPLETVLRGAKGLQKVRSESLQGLSVITATFKDGEDIFQARQALAERLSEATGELPQGTKIPKMSPLMSSTMDLLKIGLVSDKRSAMELRTFAEFTMRPRLLAVEGVAKVTVYGGDERQFQIQVDPQRLHRFDLSVTDVVNAAKLATGVAGAGWVENANQRIVLQTEGQSLTAEQLGQVMITRSGHQSLRLAEVADVVENAAPKVGDASIMGRPGVLLAMASQFGANTLDVTEAVETALKDLVPACEAQGIVIHPALHRPATFIDNALHNVRHALLLGTAFVALVLVVFLLDLRTAFISFLSIPLSLLAAVLVFHGLGITLNTMTLGGFAVAIGVVVDDAIIDVENITRRLRENAALSAPRPALKVILDASLEVRSAVVYATFVVALVFLPVLMMTGLQGKFFAPLGHAFILATMASLLVALTVTPALCLLMLNSRLPHREPFWVRWMKQVHLAALGFICARPKQSVIAVFLLFLASLVTLPFFKAALLPEFREGHFVAQLKLAPGASLPEMMRIGNEASRLLLENEHIATVEQQAGRAEQGEDTWGPHQCEYHIELKPGTSAEDEAEVQEFIRKTLESFPGTQSEVLTFLGDRIGESISGETAQVAVHLFGEDLDALDAAAKQTEAALQSVNGSRDVQVKSQTGAPRFVIRLRFNELLRLGFRPVEVMEAVQTGYQGADVAEVHEGNRTTPVVVLLPPEMRQDGRNIGDLLVANSSGVRLPLRELADIYATTGRFSIQHDDSRRLQTVTCNTKAGTDIAVFTEEARKTIMEKVKLPAGAYFTMEGAAQEAASSQRELLIHSVLAGVAIMLLLSLVFRQAHHLLLVLANVPFALTGGLFCAFVTGGTLSIGSLVGFVTLFGISLRNSIMLISHYQHLVDEEGAAWSLETVVRGASERLIPILMTALVTALGLLPLAIKGGEAGSEIEHPMALVILGGLLSSTLLNLLILPAIALVFGKFERSAAV
jgi:CzcA family heavy metal efflux pump